MQFCKKDMQFYCFQMPDVKQTFKDMKCYWFQMPNNSDFLCRVIKAEKFIVRNYTNGLEMLIRKRLSILCEGIEQKRCVHYPIFTSTVKMQKTLIQKYKIWNHSVIFLVPVRLTKKSLSIYEKRQFIKCIISKMVSKVTIDNLSDVSTAF